MAQKCLARFNIEKIYEEFYIPLIVCEIKSCRFTMQGKSIIVAFSKGVAYYYFFLKKLRGLGSIQARLLKHEQDRARLLRLGPSGVARKLSWGVQLDIFD